MKKNLIIGLKMTVLAVLFTACSKDKNDTVAPTVYEETVVVANRVGGSISFIDANTNAVTKTLSIKDSEPMYVVYVWQRDKMYVGDRKGKMVHVVNMTTKEVEKSIDLFDKDTKMGGNGVFHMWADGLGKELWVSNDIDNTISVINLNTNAVTNTIEVGGKPHDVFLTKDATRAYVSVISTGMTPDKIFMYSTSTYLKTKEVSVGKDPHLFHLSNTDNLIVPCQSGQVYILNGKDLTEKSNNPFAGAHGIFPSTDLSTVFVTNISGKQLYSINSSTGVQNGTPLDALAATPHNLVVNEAGTKLFVSHSGAMANTVSTYSIAGGKTLTAGMSITAGTNPFGITYYKREVK